MLINKSGVTIIELLIYISLLGIIATIVFSFAYQIQAKNKQTLLLHANLHVTQMAIDLLGRDLRQSNQVIINLKNKLVCQTDLGQVSWFYNQEKQLLRLDQQVKLKNPAKKNLVKAPAKVLENLKSFKITQVKLKSGAVLIKVRLVDSKQNKLEKTVLLRSSMSI